MPGEVIPRSAAAAPPPNEAIQSVERRLRATRDRRLELVAPYRAPDERLPEYRRISLQSIPLRQPVIRRLNRLQIRAAMKVAMHGGALDPRRALRFDLLDSPIVF